MLRSRSLLRPGSDLQAHLLRSEALLRSDLVLRSLHPELRQLHRSLALPEKGLLRSAHLLRSGKDLLPGSDVLCSGQDLLPGSGLLRSGQDLLPGSELLLGSGLLILRALLRRPWPVREAAWHVPSQ